MAIPGTPLEIIAGRGWSPVQGETHRHSTFAIPADTFSRFGLTNSRVSVGIEYKDLCPAGIRERFLDRDKYLESAPFSRHDFAVKANVQLDPSNRIILSKDLRRAAGFGPRQKLKASAGPGRIVLEVESNSNGKVVKRGKLKVWTGPVPDLPLADAVEHSRRYER